MFIESSLKESAHARRQIPAALIESLVKANREGVTDLPVAVLDQLAPAVELVHRKQRNAQSLEAMHMPTIPDAIRSLCYIAPPASIGSPVVTMAPDKADRGTFPPETILNQWRECIDTSCKGNMWHNWLGVKFGSIARVDGYRLAAMSPLIIKTWSTEPYANVWLHLNPAESEILNNLPKAAPPRLISYLSHAGHGNGVAIVPASFADLFNCSAETVRANGTVSDVASAIAQLWNPDAYIKHPEDALQKGFGIHHTSPHAANLPELPNGWGSESNQQILTEGQMQAALRHDLVGLIVIAEGGGDSVLLMTNAISGHDGGF